MKLLLGQGSKGQAAHTSIYGLTGDTIEQVCSDGEGSDWHPDWHPSDEEDGLHWL
jgi:hypothetical protein